MSTTPRCAECPNPRCEETPFEKLNRGTLPKNCPMRISPQTVEAIVKRYREPVSKKLYVSATTAEREAYETVRGAVMAVRPRVKELVEFAKLLKLKRIGVAFCAGLRDEASRLVGILKREGFTVSSAVCKCGATDKTKLGVDKKHKIGDPEKFESACNPILQAEVLNNAATEVNVIVGLCIGHDMLFTMNSKAPVTTLIVKDRLLAHNPVMALYSSYHKGIVESQRRV
jgi:uncharacterized metal-binding protein